MVINVGAFVGGAVALDLSRLADIRFVALKVCYSIPGYADLDRETKNNVYDLVRDDIEKSFQG